jgi:hypothetical protein
MHTQAVAGFWTVLAVTLGCSLAVLAETDTDLAAAMIRAADLNKPLMVLVAEPGQSRADDASCALLKSHAVEAQSSRCITFLLDIGVSRNRATATRFHVVDTPLLLCISPRGILLSRDEARISKKLVLQRIEEAAQQSPSIDTRFRALEQAAAENPNNISTQFDLTDFLLQHHNDLEAVPRLAVIAHSDADPAPVRVRAWVALARAHLWIAEPEKGRHEAEALMASLGPSSPEARAGRNLVLGLQDTNGKRFTIARREFEQAISAAPNSDYAKQAAEALEHFKK